MNRRIPIYAFLISCSIVSHSAQLKVLTTIAPLYCFAANIAGNAAHVENLLPPNVGPHDYQLAPQDAKKLSEADVVILNGLGLDGWLKPALAGLGGTRKPRLVDFSEGLEKELIYTSQPNQSPNPARVDPHIWLDPALVLRGLTNITLRLQEMDAPNAPIYATNMATFAVRLEKLDRELHSQMTNLTIKTVVTEHNGFAYLARHFQLVIAGTLEEFPEVPPSARHLAALSKTIRERQIKILLVEAQAESPLASQLARDLGLKLIGLETLERGSLSLNSYERDLRRNVLTLRSALK